MKDCEKKVLSDALCWEFGNMIDRYERDIQDASNYSKTTKLAKQAAEEFTAISSLFDLTK